MIDPRDWHGNSENARTINSDESLNIRSRVLVVFPNASGLAVVLPDARHFARAGLFLGPDAFIIGNSSTTNSLDVEDAVGGTIGTITAAKTSPTRWYWARVHLMLNTTAAGTWRFELRTPP